MGEGLGMGCGTRTERWVRVWVWDSYMYGCGTRTERWGTESHSKNLTITAVSLYTTVGLKGVWVSYVSY